MSNAHLGHGSFKLLVEDMVRLSAIATEENPEEPFMLLALSIESFAAQQNVLGGLTKPGGALSG
jgi:hypothetical protein